MRFTDFHARKYFNMTLMKKYILKFFPLTSYCLIRCYEMTLCFTIFNNQILLYIKFIKFTFECFLISSLFQFVWGACTMKFKCRVFEHFGPFTIAILLHSPCKIHVFSSSESNSVSYIVFGMLFFQLVICFWEGKKVCVLYTIFLSLR